MCTHIEQKNSHWYNKSHIFLFIALFGGLLAGWWHHPIATTVANVSSQLFIDLLRLISLPIIFLSILSTVSGMDGAAEAKDLGLKALRYTVTTTLAAAFIALTLFILLDPVGNAVSMTQETTTPVIEGKGYLTYLRELLPSNIARPFLENNVIGVLLLGAMFSIATLALPKENRRLLHSIFQSLFLAVMQLTSWILKLMPLAVWSFAVLFIEDLRSGLEIQSLGRYLACIIFANLAQAFLFLPLLLKSKGISPWIAFKGMFPALSVAFFSKSSAATLPTALLCATDRVGINHKVAHFTLPLCTTINMNGCAAFILTTVLFVSMSHGATYTPWEMVVWVFISTLAALGNASVPMGCYFLSSALLSGMGMPLHLMGIILPFYTFIDMLETSINVWSDGCVAILVDRDLQRASTITAPAIS